MGRIEVLRARHELGLTQQDLANLAGVHKNTLALFEAGHRTPKPETLERIVSALVEAK